MGKFYVEQRLPKTSISWDIAHHLYARYLQGACVVVCSRPIVVLSAVSKQWQKVLGAAQKERSSVLGSPRIQELSQRILYMQHIQMSVESPDDAPFEDVYFMTSEQALNHPPLCHTLYCMEEVSDASFATLCAGLSDNGLAVRYILPE